MTQKLLGATSKRSVSNIFLTIGLIFSLPVAAGSGLVTEDDIFGDIPVVTGASHFPQTISDAPTSVSIIDQKMIAASAAVEIVDLFRLIPGFQVYMPHYGRPAINYHGFPQEYSYRMEVKIDGRSVYEPLKNAVLWSTLGIELDDIDYIEVIRGANAPADGANATTASVNIITKTPLSSEGWRVRTMAVDWDTQHISATYSGIKEGFSYKINGGYRYNSGFPEIDENTVDDDTETSYLNLRSIITPTLYDSIDLQIGYSNSNIDMADGGRGLDPWDIHKWNYNNYYLFTDWKHRLTNQDSFELLFYYNHSDIDALNNLGLLSEHLARDKGVTPSNALGFLGLKDIEDFEAIVGIDDSYSERSDLEFRYQGQIGANTRYMWGLASRYDRIKIKDQDANTLDVAESSQRLFSNIETKPSEHWTLNAGAMIEYNEIVNQYGSYRLSANYHINPSHTLRLAYNHGERSPGVYEANRYSTIIKEDRVLVVGNVAPSTLANVASGTLALKQGVSVDDLTTEKFENQEISYYGRLLDQTLTLEIKLFKEENQDLVKGTIEQVGDYFDSSKPLLDDEFKLFNNFSWVNTKGIEAQLKYQPNQRWLFNFQYSYTDNEGFTLRRINPNGNLFPRNWGDEDDEVIVPPEITSLTTAYFSDSGMEASFMIYYQDEVNWDEGDKESEDHVRVDARVAKHWQIDNQKVLVELIGQNIFDNDYTDFHYLNEYKSRYLLRATLEL